MGHKFVVKGLTAFGGTSTEGVSGPVLQVGRKPFDWMSDSQWQMLLVRIIEHYSL